MHGTNWRRGANFRNWFQTFASSYLHHFTWDFTREVTKPRTIILEISRRFGGVIHPGRIIRVSAIQGGTPFSGGVSYLQGLRVDLEIWTPGLSLQLSDLSFWRVSGGLEVLFTQAELSRVPGIQGGAPISGGVQIHRV